MFNKYICSLMSIQKQFWLSRLLSRQRLPNGGETVSLLCGFWGDPLHSHPKRHEFFPSTHQSLRKDNNSDHRILSLWPGPESSNLKGCNQVILEANQCSYQIWTSTSASGSFALNLRDEMEHYLARMWNLSSDTLLQQQGLSHHGDASGRRLHSLWFHFHQ